MGGHFGDCIRRCSAGHLVLERCIQVFVFIETEIIIFLM